MTKTTATILLALATLTIGCDDDTSTTDNGMMMHADAGPDLSTDDGGMDAGEDLDEGPGWCDPAEHCADDSEGYPQTMGPDCVCRRSARFGNPCAIDAHCGRTSTMHCIPRNPLLHNWGICGECETAAQCPGAPAGESFACTHGQCVDGLTLGGDCSDSPDRPFDPSFEDGDELGTFDVGTGVPLRHVCSMDDGLGRVSPVISGTVRPTLYTSEIAEACALPQYGGVLDSTCSWCTYGSIPAGYYHARDNSVCYPPSP